MDDETLQKCISNFKQICVQQNINTIAACKFRFAGKRQNEAVEEFVNGVETFKTIHSISDEEALKGISLLFIGTASIWWQGVHKEATTWQDFLTLIREHFAPKKPPYQLYKEIFTETQDDKIGIDLFIIRKRALLAQLPEKRHDEEVELDLVFSLIHFKYRQYLKREEVTTFKELLQKARDIEANHLEATNNAEKPKRCSYCNYRGHNADECRRRQQKQQQPQIGESPNKIEGQQKANKSGK